MFAETLGWIIAEGDRKDWTSSSKIFFDLFLKLFGIRGEIDIKPKVSSFPVGSDNRRSRI